ncbi:M24 family metallopeptidase [Candidatus Undinarchaeota archaeon]
MIKKLMHQLDGNTLFLINLRQKDPNLVYLTGLSGVYGGCALMLTEKRAVFLANDMEYEHAKSELKIPVKKVNDVFEYVKKNKEGKILVNEKFLPHSTYLKIKKTGPVKYYSKELFTMRMVKEKSEIQKLRKAREIALEAYSQLNLRQKEADIARKLNYIISEKAEPSFEVISAADSNSTKPHYTTGSKIASRLLLLDFGAKYQNYCSDITRMKFFKKTSQMKKVEEAVLSARDAAIDTAKPGIAVSQVAKAANSEIKKAGFEKYILHGIGHGIGVEVHEKPFIGAKSKEIFEPGMTFTIEPGIYTKTFGIRIEDDYRITKSGCRLI